MEQSRHNDNQPVSTIIENGWLSVQNAAIWLSQKTAEDVTITDVLLLAVDRKLSLFIALLGYEGMVIDNDPEYFFTNYDSFDAFSLTGINRVATPDWWLRELQAVCYQSDRDWMTVSIVADSEGNESAIFTAAEGERTSVNIDLSDFLISRKELREILQSSGSSTKVESHIDIAAFKSPYLRLMERAVTHHNIQGDAKSMPTAASLQKWFEEQSTPDLPISGRLASAMATLVRGPKFEGGKNRNYRKSA